MLESKSSGQSSEANGNALGEWVRSRRIASSVNQRDLAARAGISRSYLCDIERGRGGQPSLGCLDRLAASLGADRAEILSAAGILGPARDAKQDKRVIDLIAVYRGLSESGQDSIERLARFLLAEEQRWIQPRLVEDHTLTETRKPQSGPTLFDFEVSKG
jgi:transcriptional regulator with XRE-family HTH domain